MASYHDQDDPERVNTAQMRVALKRYAGLMRHWLAAGPNTHAPNKAGQTVLMITTLLGHGEIVDVLFACGADPNQQDAAGNSAPSVATSLGNKSCG